MQPPPTGAPRMTSNVESARLGIDEMMSLAASAPVGLFVATAEEGVVLVNDRYGEITGRPESDLLGAGWIETIHSDQGFLIAPPQPAADLAARLVQAKTWL